MLDLSGFFQSLTAGLQDSVLAIVLSFFDSLFQAFLGGLFPGA
jgi:hypothetical protein